MWYCLLAAALCVGLIIWGIYGLLTHSRRQAIAEDEVDNTEILSDTQTVLNSAPANVENEKTTSREKTPGSKELDQDKLVNSTTPAQTSSVPISPVPVQALRQEGEVAHMSITPESIGLASAASFGLAATAALAPRQESQGARPQEASTQVAPTHSSAQANIDAEITAERDRAEKNLQLQVLAFEKQKAELEKAKTDAAAALQQKTQALSLVEAELDKQKKQSSLDQEGLRAKLEIMEGELAALKPLEAKLSQATQQLQITQTQLKTQETQAQTLASQVKTSSDAEKALVAVRSELEALKKSQADSSQRANMLEAQLKAKTTDNEALIAQVKSAVITSSELSSMRAEFEALKKSHGEANQRASTLEAQLQTKTAENEALAVQAKAAATTSTQLSAVRSELEALKKSHAEAGQRAKTLEDQLKAQQERVTLSEQTLSSRIKLWEAEKGNLEKSKEDAEKAKADQARELSEKAAALEKLQVQFQAKTVEAETLVAQAKTAATAGTELGNQMAKMRSEIEAQKKENTEVSQRLSLAQAELKTQQDRMAQTQQTHQQTLTDRLKGFESEKAELLKAKLSAETAKSEMVAQLAQQAAALSQLQNQQTQHAVTLKQRSEEHEAQRAQLTQQLSSAQRETEQTKAQLNAAKAEHETLVRQAHEMQAKIQATAQADAAWRQRLAQLEAEHVSNAQALSNLKQQHTEQQALLTKVQTESAHAREQLEQQSKAQTQAQGEWQARQVQWQAQLDQTRQELQVSQGAASERQKQLQMLQNQLQVSQAKVAQTEQQIQVAAQTHLQQNQTLHTRLRSLDDELKKANDQHSQLAAQTKAQVEQSHSAAGILQTQLEKERAQAATLAAQLSQLQSTHAQEVRAAKSALTQRELQLSQIEQELAKKDRSIAEHVQRSHTTAAQLAKLESSANADSLTKSQELEQIRQQLLKQKSAYEISARQVQERDVELAQLRQQLATMRVDIQNQAAREKLVAAKASKSTIKLVTEMADDASHHIKTKAKPKIAAKMDPLVKVLVPGKTSPVKVVKAPAPKAPGRGNDRDDLKKIFGVGPVMEKFLHKNGIYWFSEVARWTNAEIDQFEEKLPNFKGRIHREDWRNSAREEHHKKYGEFPKKK